MEKNLKITSCLQCPFHEIMHDPDPNDWFNDDDVSVVCKKVKKEKEPSSEYASDRQEHKVVSFGDRPYQVKEDKIKIPEWCPL